MAFITYSPLVETEFGQNDFFQLTEFGQLQLTDFGQLQLTDFGQNLGGRFWPISAFQCFGLLKKKKQTKQQDESEVLKNSHPTSPEGWGPRVGAPAALGLHTTTRELQTCTFEGPAFKNTIKIPREDPQRKTKRGRAPTLRAPSGPHRL